MKRLLKAFNFRLRVIVCLSTFAILHLFALLSRPVLAPKRIWLLLERGSDAQDNAWHLLKYLRANHPEVNVKYAINLDSPDYINNLSEYRDVVIKYGSLRYFAILFNADYVISTHVQTYPYFHIIFDSLQKTCIDIKAKKVFLQHGCIHNFHPTFEFPKLNVKLFIAGAKNEEQLLLTKYHYPSAIVRYTGLARFDNLHNFSTQRVILVMPTWRAMFTGYSPEEITKTDFFMSYYSILTDPRLLQKLKSCDYEVVFYNHIEFQKYNSCFMPIQNERVRIVQFGEESVQSLLRRSQLLVTDYSSVYYDFFYMKKPIVFFKLGQEVFQSSQYGDDFDDPSDFGCVSFSAEGTIKALLDFLDNPGALNEKYESFHSSVFPLYDQKNCERIYEEIHRLS